MYDLMSQCDYTHLCLAKEICDILEDLKIWCGQFAFGLILKYLDTIPSYVRNDYFRIWEYYNFIKLLEELKTQNKK